MKSIKNTNELKIGNLYNFYCPANNILGRFIEVPFYIDLAKRKTILVPETYALLYLGKDAAVKQSHWHQFLYNDKIVKCGLYKKIYFFDFELSG